MKLSYRANEASGGTTAATNIPPEKPNAPPAPPHPLSLNPMFGLAQVHAGQAWEGGWWLVKYMGMFGPAQ